MGWIVVHLLRVLKYTNSKKKKNSEASATSLWLFLGNVSNGFSVDNTENIYVDMFMVFSCLW